MKMRNECRNEKERELEKAIRKGDTEKADRLVEALWQEQGMEEDTSCPMDFTSNIAWRATAERSKMMKNVHLRKSLAVAACAAVVAVSGLTAANAATEGALWDQFTMWVTDSQTGETTQETPESVDYDQDTATYTAQYENGDVLVVTSDEEKVDDYFRSIGGVEVFANADGTYSDADGKVLTAEEEKNVVGGIDDRYFLLPEDSVIGGGTENQDANTYIGAIEADPSQDAGAKN